MVRGYMPYTTREVSGTMHPSRRQIRESLEAGRYTSVKPRPRRARALVPGLPMTIRETLYRRLKKHTGSIESSSNLDVADFHVRALVLAYVWVPMAETSAIAMHRPLWNTLVDGFGNHDPGRGRYEGMRSRWDTLHPGRRWAEKLRPNVYTARQIGEEALAWLVQQAPEYRIIPL